jgi:prevent-host-death family protein
MGKEISVAEFVARPIELLEEASRTQEEIVIVRDGKPLAKLVGRSAGDIQLDEDAIARRREGLEKLRGSVKILGDIVEPIDWNEIE